MVIPLGPVGAEPEQELRRSQLPKSTVLPGDAPTYESVQRSATGRAQIPGHRDDGGLTSDMPPPSAGERARLRWAAEQLEALLIYEMLKSARGTVLKTGLLDSQATKMFEEMLDEERAGQMARGGGMGLAELIYEQMSRHLAPDDEEESKERS